MTSQNPTADYVEFLKERGSISHIVSAPEGATLSTLALTQRCLASGISFPVPLPDGSVAINVSGDVPASLSALDLVIEDVTAGFDAEPDDDHPEDVEPRSFELAPEVEPDEPSGTLEAMDGAPEEGGSASAAPTEIPGDDEPPDAEVGDQPFEAEEPEGDAHPIQTLEDGDAESETAEPEADLEEIAEPQHDAFVEGMTEVSAADPVASEDPSEAVEVPADQSGFGTPPAPGASPDVLDALSDLVVRIDGLATEQSQIVRSIAEIRSTVEEALSRPLPRPDVSEFNRGLAKMTAAFAHAVQRMEAAADALGAAKATDGGSEVATALSAGLSALSEAVRLGAAARAGRDVHGADLAVIASMQETLSHQLSKLIESGVANGPPAMEELLMDLRHATAELVAEQTRRASAS